MSVVVSQLSEGERKQLRIAEAAPAAQLSKSDYAFQYGTSFHPPYTVNIQVRPDCHVLLCTFVDTMPDVEDRLTFFERYDIYPRRVPRGEYRIESSKWLNYVQAIITRSNLHRTESSKWLSYVRAIITRSDSSKEIDAKDALRLCLQSGSPKGADFAPCPHCHFVRNKNDWYGLAIALQGVTGTPFLSPDPVRLRMVGNDLDWQEFAIIPHYPTLSGELVLTINAQVVSRLPLDYTDFAEILVYVDELALSCRLDEKRSRVGDQTTSQQRPGFYFDHGTGQFRTWERTATERQVLFTTHGLQARKGLREVYDRSLGASLCALLERAQGLVSRANIEVTTGFASRQPLHRTFQPSDYCLRATLPPPASLQPLLDAFRTLKARSEAHDDALRFEKDLRHKCPPAPDAHRDMNVLVTEAELVIAKFLTLGACEASSAADVMHAVAAHFADEKSQEHDMIQ